MYTKLFFNYSISPWARPLIRPLPRAPNRNKAQNFLINRIFFKGQIC